MTPEEYLKKLAEIETAAREKAELHRLSVQATQENRALGYADGVKDARELLEKILSEMPITRSPASSYPGEPENPNPPTELQPIVPEAKPELPT